ncbi:MAG: hypothetical protein ABIN37_05370 [Burkholderiaceae bacterium]
MQLDRQLEKAWLGARCRRPQDERMRRLGQTLRDSVFGALRLRKEAPNEDIEGIRSAMLQALGQSSNEESGLERRLLYAPDAEALWYTRPALMNVVAARDGETNAQKSLDQVTAMFKDCGPHFTPRANWRRHH